MRWKDLGPVRYGTIRRRRFFAWTPVFAADGYWYWLARMVRREQCWSCTQHPDGWWDARWETIEVHPLAHLPDAE